MKKQTLKVRGNQLRLGLSTDINRRAMTAAGRRDNTQKPAVRNLMKQASSRMLKAAAAAPVVAPSQRARHGRVVQEDLATVHEPRSSRRTNSPKKKPAVAKTKAEYSDSSDSETAGDVFVPDIGVTLETAEQHRKNVATSGLKVAASVGPAHEGGIRAGMLFGLFSPNEVNPPFPPAYPLICFAPFFVFKMSGSQKKNIQKRRRH